MSRKDDRLKDPEKTQSGLTTYTRRADYQAQTHTPTLNGRIPANKLAENPLFRARDHIMTTLSGHCTDTVFGQFGELSLNKVDSLKFNSAKALFSDLKSYLAFIKAQQAHLGEGSVYLTALPISDRLLCDYLTHLQIRTDKNGRLIPASRATILRHVASLDKWHRFLALPKPSHGTHTATAIETLVNHTDGEQAQKSPLKIEHIEKAMQVLDQSRPTAEIDTKTPKTQRLPELYRQ